MNVETYIALAQANGGGSMIGIDPTPFTAWGVLGLLAIVVLVLVGIIWKLFNRSTAAMESQTQTLMEFVNDHRAETTKALSEISAQSNQAIVTSASTVASSQDRMTSAFAKMARMIDELVRLERVIDRASKQQTSGAVLTDETIDRIIRSVKSSYKDEM